MKGSVRATQRSVRTFRVCPSKESDKFADEIVIADLNKAHKHELADRCDCSIVGIIWGYKESDMT